jgi:hypothetical protein
MTDYSNNEAYLLQTELIYRPEKYYYPVGNDSKNFGKQYGAGRPQINHALSPAGQAINNPYLAQTCYLQAPIVWMQSAPYDPKTGKFTDTFFYKNHRFAPGSN